MNRKIVSNRSAKRRPLAVPRSPMGSTAFNTAVRCSGPSDPPAISGRPWNKIVVSATINMASVQAFYEMKPTNVADIFLRQTGYPTSIKNDLEFRIHAISAWGRNYPAEPVALTVFQWVAPGSIVVAQESALQLQDQPTAIYRANVHCKTAPIVHSAPITSTLFTLYSSAANIPVLCRMKLSWRIAETASPPTARSNPLNATIIVGDSSVSAAPITSSQQEIPSLLPSPEVQSQTASSLHETSSDSRLEPDPLPYQSFRAQAAPLVC